MLLLPTNKTLRDEREAFAERGSVERIHDNACVVAHAVRGEQDARVCVRVANGRCEEERKSLFLPVRDAREAAGGHGLTGRTQAPRMGSAQGQCSPVHATAHLMFSHNAALSSSFIS